MLFLGLGLTSRGEIEGSIVMTMTVAMMGSFGPVVALSALSNNLNQTLASGERVLSLLEEKPEVYEIPDDENSVMEIDNAADINIDDVSFSYSGQSHDEFILRNFNAKIKNASITGIHGESGCGKSTLLRLIMRFWDVNSGNILINDNAVNKIPTSILRKSQGFMTQDTHLFSDTIRANIAIAKPDASDEEIISACKKSSVHDFIMSLPNGYDTNLSELGSNLSGGEKQRIGIARAFLQDAPILLLDEPTSNLDSLNEGVILKALKEESRGKNVVLVSHKKSTLKIADEIIEMSA